MQALLVGLGIGLAAGISPGPLLMLVITSTLRGGLRHGVAVAVAPLLTDAVVVGVTLATLGRIPQQWLSVLGVVGGAVVMVIGVRTVLEGRVATLGTEPAALGGQLTTALTRGGVVNFLSPHPWITWITALGPLTVATWRDSQPAGVSLVAGFYLTLVGSKIAVAGLVAGGRRRLTDAGYRRAVVGAGAALVALGALLVIEFGANTLP
jgi:threonine/homoserine/homoserine lactone efflux protein